MALTDLTRISTSGIATGSTIDSPILRKDVDFRGDQVGVGSALFDSSEKELNLKDNVKLTFGDKTNGDLQVYHDGGQSYIKDNGTGQLYIQGSAAIHLENSSGNKKYFRGVNGAASELFFDGNKKIETTDDGALVTGILTATSFSGGITGNIVGNVYAASGISTFYDLRVTNNLTVEGTTTTLDTNLIGVDRVEVGANSNSIVGVAITQSGTADIVNLFDGGTNVLTVTDTGDVGIGSAIPGVLLDVQGHGGGGAQYTIRSKSTAANASNFVRSESNDGLYIGLLKYGTGHSAYGALPAGGGAVYANSSVPITIMSDGGSGYINFATGGNTEKLRITSDGHIVTQGLTSYTFNNDGANTKIFEVTGDGTVGEYGVINISGNQNADDGTLGIIKFVNRENSASSSGSGSGSKQVGSIEMRVETADSNAGDDCGGYMRFVTKSDGGGGSERMRVTSSGNVEITDGDLKISTSGHGIDFSATSDSTGTTQSEILDDYEEGTWTPTIAYSNSGSATLSEALGYYTKIGRKVHVIITITVSAQGSGSGNVQLGGLPYTTGSSASGLRLNGFFTYQTAFSNLNSPIMTYRAGASTHMVLFHMDSINPTSGIQNVTRSNITDSTTIRGQAEYYVD